MNITAALPSAVITIQTKVPCDIYINYVEKLELKALLVFFVIEHNLKCSIKNTFGTENILLIFEPMR